MKPGKKSKDKKESTVKLTVKVYGRTKLIEKALYSAKIKLNVGSQFVHKAEWVPLGDKPKKGDPEVYVDYSVVLFPTKLSPVPRPNLMYRILLQRLHEHEVSTHPAFNCGLLCEGAAKTSDGSGTFDVPLYTEDLRRLVRDCLSHYGITRLSPLL